MNWGYASSWAAEGASGTQRWSEEEREIGLRELLQYIERMGRLWTLNNGGSCMSNKLKMNFTVINEPLLIDKETSQKHWDRSHHQNYN